MITFGTKQGGKKPLVSGKKQCVFPSPRIRARNRNVCVGASGFTCMPWNIPAGLVCLKLSKKMVRILKEKDKRRKVVTLGNLGDLFLTALYYWQFPAVVICIHLLRIAELLSLL